MSTSPPERLQEDNLAALVFKREAWRRANVENEHFVFAIVGREGSGKSGTALSIAEALDPDFHAGRVSFKPAEMLKLIQSDETGRGSVMVLDEAGVGMGARSWYDQDQIKLNKTLQTIRDDNQILILTLPALSELDSQTINRLHAYGEITTLVPGEKARMKFKFIEPSRGPNGQAYEKYPRMRVGGQRAKVTRLSVGPPSDDLWEEYEQRKDAFKEALYADTIDELESGNGENEQPDPKDVVEQIRSEEGVEHYTREINNGAQTVLDADLIAAEYDLGTSTAKKVKSVLLKNIDEDFL